VAGSSSGCSDTVAFVWCQHSFSLFHKFWFFHRFNGFGSSFTLAIPILLFELLQSLFILFLQLNVLRVKIMFLQYCSF
jgi:hypothetical protein